MLKVKKAVLIILIAISTIVFINATIGMINSQGYYDTVEIIFYFIGYILSVASVVLSLFMLHYTNAETKNKVFVSILYIGIITMVLLFVHDILMYIDMGNDVGGLYSLFAFLVLDVFLIAFYCLVGFIRKRHFKATKTCLFIICILLGVYVFGEVAGYQLQTFDDWDEMLILFNYFISAIVMLNVYKKVGNSK